MLLMLANSFPLNSTMEYTAPFTSFSARLCSFPGINPHSAKLCASCSQGQEALGGEVQTSCFKYCSLEDLWASNTGAAGQQGADTQKADHRMWFS